MWIREAAQISVRARLGSDLRVDRAKTAGRTPYSRAPIHRGGLFAAVARRRVPAGNEASRSTTPSKAAPRGGLFAEVARHDAPAGDEWLRSTAPSKAVLLKARRDAVPREALR